jgi:hypothetical protein
MSSKRWLFLNVSFCFSFFPSALFCKTSIGFSNSFLLLFLSLICILFLRKEPEFDEKVSRRKPRLEHLKSIMTIFSARSSDYHLFCLPSRFFKLPVPQPFIWLTFVLLYPSQVVYFRNFFSAAFSSIATGSCSSRKKNR